MEKYVSSSDGTMIHYQITGAGSRAIIFIHGWLGNVEWWENQKIHFEKDNVVILMDLAGHGKSDKSRIEWTAKLYSDDIEAVVNQLSSSSVIVVAHSMAGAFALEAASSLGPTVSGVVLIDTLKNLDMLMGYDQAEQFILRPYKTDFKAAVETILPKHLFTQSTPGPVKERLQSEFLKYDGTFAAKVIEPLYRLDIQKVAQSVSVPVRAINSDSSPTHVANNRKYFKDYDFVTIKGTGHYPMLECPVEFNLILENIIQSFKMPPSRSTSNT